MSGIGRVSTLFLQPLVLALPSPDDHADFCRAVGVDFAQLGDPDATVGGAQLARAWEELARRCARPRVALELAEVVPDGSFGLVEYLCRACPTVGVAARQWTRYLGLLNDTLRVETVEGRAAGGGVEDDVVAFRARELGDAPAPLSHELCFAVLALRLRALAARPVEVRRVAFAHAGADADAYGRWFGAPVSFRAPYTELVLARSALDVPLATADARLHALLLKSAEPALPARDAGATPRSLREEVAAVLEERLAHDDAHVEVVARRLGTTSRSLQRRLRDEGTSFLQVREEVRRTLATRHLDGGRSIAEISFLLGFSEPSAFFRAFKRWTGTTPEESRALRAAGAPA